MVKRRRKGEESTKKGGEMKGKKIRQWETLRLYEVKKTIKENNSRKEHTTEEHNNSFIIFPTFQLQLYFC